MTKLPLALVELLIREDWQRMHQHRRSAQHTRHPPTALQHTEAARDYADELRHWCRVRRQMKREL